MALGALFLVGAAPAEAADHHVPADYATIQEAVNVAASGDTIHIAPGVYVEQTWITNKNLTLIGQPGTILRAFPGMEPAWPSVIDQRCIIAINESPSVIIRNLTFEGDQMADQNQPELRGVNFDISGGAVENCRFTGFRERTPGATEAVAINFWNGLSSARALEAHVQGNIIEDSYFGIKLIGAPNRLSYNIAIENNTLRGVGPTSTTGEPSRRGMYLANGITGSVTGNSISDYSYDGVGAMYPFGFGIIAGGQGDSLPDAAPVDYIRFENNTFRNNNLHMVLIKAKQHEIVNNRFEGTGPGQRPVGLWITGEAVKVHGNVFLNTQDGIRVGGVDPDFETILGLASNAQLIDNRFCNVTTSIEVQPMATATETGTLMCPFPDPELKILSWPGIEEGFSVQSAPAPGGPWALLDATPIRQDGQNRVFVPAGSDAQFFRLAKP